MTICFFDSETGGLTPAHPTIQIAAIAVTDDLATELETFEVKIRFDEATAEAEALRINRYDPAVWKTEAFSELEALSRFGDFCRRHATVDQVGKAGKPFRVARLAGHNVASFDCPRLVDAFKRHRLFLPATGYQPFDTYQRALWHFAERGGPRPPNMQLPTLAEHFGLDATGAHDALVDCRLALGIARAVRR